MRSDSVPTPRFVPNSSRETLPRISSRSIGFFLLSQDWARKWNSASCTSSPTLERSHTRIATKLFLEWRIDPVLGIPLEEALQVHISSRQRLLSPAFEHTLSKLPTSRSSHQLPCEVSWECQECAYLSPYGRSVIHSHFNLMLPIIW